jgi:hypothetical protein
MTNERQKKTRTLKTAALAAVILVHLVALFDAEGLKIWAERLKDETAQSLLLPPLEAWFNFSQAVGAAKLRTLVSEELFAPVRDAAWPEGTIAAAVVTPAPTLPPEAATPVFSPDNPLDILVLGDSLAGFALPSMLNQAVAGNKSIRVVYEAHVSSSIAQPVYYNWPVEIKRIMATQLLERGKPFDLAVVVIGSNDAQTIKSGGRYYDFGSDGWNDLFRARAVEFMTIVSDGCGRVFWCGVPPMRKEGYRDRMVVLNGLYGELTLGFENIRSVPLDFLGDENGLYAQTKVIGRAERVVRSADGVHLAFPGAELVVNRLFELIDLDFRFERPEDRPAPSNVGP